MDRILETPEESKLMFIEAGVIAALYSAITIALAPISYGPVQFRVSDIMLALPFHKRFRKSGIIGLTIGGFIGNIASVYLPWDLIFGPIINGIVAAIMALLGLYYQSVKTKGNPKLVFYGLYALGAVLGAIVIGSLVSLEIVLIEEGAFVFDLFLIIAFSIFLSELVALGIGGAILIMGLMRAIPSEALDTVTHDEAGSGETNSSEVGKEDTQ